MPCGNCGTELLPGKNFCHACGTPLQAACRNCGETLNPEFRFCPECGTAAGEVAATSSLPAREDPPESDPLQRHLPEGLASKIRRVGAVAGERKRATVLFCDLVGSTAIAEGLDPEEYRELLDQFLEIAFGEIYRHEGIVNQLAGDGFMALFGAPITHEDDPERAVRAALGIQKALEQLHTRVRSEGGVELTARIGIHTGTVVVGTMGNDLKTDYTAIGDTTNLAARLQSLASPGSILISEATSSLVRGHFRTKSVGPLEVKGKSEPINAQEIIEIANATPMGIAKARGLTPLFGREPEIAQLMGCFSRLDDRLAQVVSIVGDAGSGKSRLIYEFKKR
ncbi:MAG: hypothetical protein GY725_06775, partial [bacterium]|nr:hypothetical protein [bacterium]